jgi:hypothetical protein
MKRIALLFSLLAIGAAPAFGQDTTTRIRGTIVSLEGNVLTVATAGENRRVTLTDGFRVVFVSKDTPIVAYEAGDAKALVLGAHVYIIAQRGPDGTLSSGRVNVGKNGLVPPM